ncbi:MAG: polysaccharide pyruvyl transferase family protein, partial [Pseudomonadales bacterium]|nr:polysaccharide pyruvyl transferase family protein [Pseudomonadales bacterium]
MTRSRSIALRGNFDESNFGDDALLLASSRLLSQAQSQLYVLGSYSFPDPRLEKVEASNELLSDTGLIVHGGGTQFFSFDESQPPNLVQTWILDPLRLAKRRLLPGVPRIGIGLGLGPFGNNTRQRSEIANLLKTMPFVWVRDDDSMSFCNRENVRGAFRSADLCFTSAFRENLPAVSSQPESNTEPSVAVVLRDWIYSSPHWYSDVTQAMEKVRAEGISVEYFSFAPTDQESLKLLVQNDEQVVCWPGPDTDLETFWQRLVKHSLIVTARYHGGVFALLSETPFLTINIEPKLEQLGSQISNAEHIDLTDNPGQMSEKILSALRRIPVLKEDTSS